MLSRLTRRRSPSVANSQNIADCQTSEVDERNSKEDNDVEKDHKKKASRARRLIWRTTGKQRQESSRDHSNATAIPSDLTTGAHSGVVLDSSPLSDQTPFVLHVTRPLSPVTPNPKAKKSRKKRQKSDGEASQLPTTQNSLAQEDDSGLLTKPSSKFSLRLFPLRRVKATRSATAQLDATSNNQLDPIQPTLVQPSSIQPHFAQLSISTSEPTHPGVSQSRISVPEYFPPDITQPRIIGPEIAPPGIFESELTQPDIARPSIFGSEFTQPDIARPNIFESEFTQSDIARLSIFEPELTQPDITRPIIFGSEFTQPHTVRPSIFESNSIQPYIVQPSIFEAEPTYRGLTHLSTFDLEPTQPDIIQPSIFEPELILPGFFESDLIQLDCENMAAVDRLSFLMVEKPYARFAIQEARKAEREIREILYKTNTPFPPYNFLELIGKGTYGRVYKVKDVKNRRFVALKIVDCDTADFKAPRKYRDLTIAEMIKETTILADLKRHGVKNINIIFDAFELHSQVWILSEYCPGGSIKTLMRAKSPLEERYIKVIARELAVGLESIHSIGILHRDIKGANVMIHERGELQIIDFGVAATLSSSNNKRSTVIGTPHWMSPELMLTSRPKYGKEVDVWAYGCTLFEMAMGLPPGAAAGRKPNYIELMKNPPRLEDESYSVELREFIAYILQPKTEDRKTMTEICKHQYISANQEEYPTQILSEMVRRFQSWEQAGNQRGSLINPNIGAALMQAADFAGDGEDWNFSTTAQELDDLELDITVEDIDTALSRDAASSTNQFRALSKTQNVHYTSDPFTSPITPRVGDQDQLQTHSDFISPSSSQYSQPIPRLLFENDSTVSIHADDHGPQPGTISDNISPDTQREVMSYAIDDTTMTHSQGSGMIVPEQFKSANGKSIERGAAALHDIYDPKANDLPLRTSDDTSTNHQELQVEAGPSSAVPAVVLSNVATVRANAQKNKRKTMEWSFADASAQAPAVPSRPQLLHSVTAPAGPVHDASGALDLDAMMEGGTGALDLDALMAGDSEAESSTARPYGQKQEEDVEEEEMAPANRFATGPLRTAPPASRPRTVFPSPPAFPFHIYNDECTDEELAEELRVMLLSFGDAMLVGADIIGEMMEEERAAGLYDHDEEEDGEEGVDDEEEADEE
ncbi:hypothetical protein MMC27_006438 [Xylographa pallens]|nr:hypothetical protein [Xylographa pallens]